MSNLPNTTIVKQEELPADPKSIQNQLLFTKISSNDSVLSRSQVPLAGANLPLMFSQAGLQPLLKASTPFEGKIPIDVNYLKNLIAQNEMMSNQINSLLIQRENLFRTLNYYEQKFATKEETKAHAASEQSEEAKKKRFRRSAKDITRMFRCPIVKCSKSYGSEGSLHQHIRLKHPEFDIVSWIQSRITEGGCELSKINSNESRLTADTLIAERSELENKSDISPSKSIKD